MKSIFVLILLILFVCFVPTQAQKVNLPKDCLKILNKKFRGWKLVKVKEVEGVLGHNLIKGDWNGDRKTDYAILIEYGKNRLGNGALEPAVWTIAFIKQKSVYSVHKIDGGDSIFLKKKGNRDYSYDTQKNFIYKNDAIFVAVNWSGSSYIWGKGRFVGIATSD